jgi:hypothetical protein
MLRNWKHAMGEGGWKVCSYISRNSKFRHIYGKTFTSVKTLMRKTQNSFVKWLVRETDEGHQQITALLSQTIVRRQNKCGACLERATPPLVEEEDPFKKTLSGLGGNKNVVMGPDGSRNQEWLCWWRPAANWCYAMKFLVTVGWRRFDSDSSGNMWLNGFGLKHSAVLEYKLFTLTRDWIPSQTILKPC